MDNNNKAITTKVAFLLPVFNGEFSIRKTLESLLMQNYLDFNIYIINNGSTDNTKNIVAEYSKLDNRIKYYELEYGNLTKALCFALEVIKEKYILRIDSGDISDINRVRKTLIFMDKNKDCALSYTDFYVKEGKKKKLFKLPNTIRKRDFVYKNKLAHSTLCLRKETLSNINLSYSGVKGAKAYFGPSQDLLLLCIAKFEYELKIEKVPNTYTEITKNIKDSISFLKKNEQSITALRIFLINNLKLFIESKNLLFKFKILLFLIINIFRLFRYKETPLKIYRFISIIICDSKNKSIYQKIINS